MKLSVTALNASLSALGIDQTDANAQGWATVGCPACGTEDRPSLRVNVHNGEYKCFRCAASSKGDDGVPLDQFVASPSSPGLVGASKSDVPPLTDDLLARYHRILMDSPDVVADLERKRGWTESTVKKLGIAWDGSHLWLPIRSLDGQLLNARLYDPFKRTRTKSFHYANAEGLKRTAVWVPFGTSSIKNSPVVWMFEGEPDGILAAQMQFPAVVITGGAGTWVDEVLSVIGDRKVVLCYDMDAAGRRGARAIRARLGAHGVEALHLEFPLSDSKYKDFSDAIIKDKRDAKWFKKLAQDQWEGKRVDGDSTKPPVHVKLGGGVPGEPITVKAHVLGTHTVPVIVPQLVEARCRMNWNEERCNACPVQRAQGNLPVEVQPDSRELMLMCSTPVKQQPYEFKRMSGIPARCPLVRFEPGGMWQVQHLKLIPPMSERHGGDSTIRNAMFVSPADGRPLPVRSNQLYMFNGKIEPDVTSNEWTLLSSDAVPAEDDIDSFRLESGLVDHLRGEFCPPEWTVDDIDRIMAAEERSLSRHVTRIYGRYELLRLIDLTYHSVLKFRFRDRTPQRGWLSLAVLGDTRTGKSETMSSYMRYMGLGKYVMDPANTTYAGLVGGLQQVGRGDKSWTVTWGLIPTNDRGIVIVDEISSLSTDDIGKMSGMRSSGIAEITKIRGAVTPARTRIIMAGNPRGLGRMLSSYGTPVEGLMELIGAPEDVARFDIAMAVPQGLSKDQADRELGPQPQPIMIDLRRALVKFAWSRREDQVEWEPGAEELAANMAVKMARKYDHRIPLVEPAEQDIKIARLAVASAVRTFSVRSDDPNVVLVRKCHVEFAVMTMDRAYSGDLGYDAYSEYLGRHKLNVEVVKSTVIEVNPMAVDATCRALLAVRRVNPNSIGMALALDGGEARQFIAKMAQNGAARFDHENSRNTAMSWTPAFMSMLRRMERDPPEREESDLF